MTQPHAKTLVALALVFVMVFSFFVLGRVTSSPDTQAGTVRSIDDKTQTALRLTATATLVSAGLSAMPQDITTPIAQKLADFSEYFLLILCVLFTEKYLITIIGAAVFRILIPLCCLLLIACLYFRSEKTARIAVKLAAVGLALYFAIPCSIWVSDMIYDSYRSSIDDTIASAEALTDETAALNEQDPAGLSGLLPSITDAVHRLTERASGILRRFVETLAIMIVTSCLIPLLSLVFFLWLIKQLTGLDVLSRFSLPGMPRRHDSGRPGI